MEIGIVTVLYNSAPDLPDFFCSLDGQTCRGFTLYIVDNASPDDSLKQAERLAKIVDFQTIFIRNEQNGGIAQGNNLGIRAAREAGCEWIVLANNDTVWESDTLAVLLEQVEQNNARIASPKILAHNTDRLWYAGGRRNRWRGGTVHFRNDRIEAPAKVEYAPTCCMLIHRAVFDRIGPMDEHFFLYYDDTDFVRRARGAGIAVWYIPQAVIRHKEGSSGRIASPTAQYWLSRNLLLFTHKHHSKTYWYYVLTVSLLILFGKRLFTFGRPEWLASRRGLRDGVRACRRLPAEPISEKAWRT